MTREGNAARCGLVETARAGSNGTSGPIIHRAEGCTTASVTEALVTSGDARPFNRDIADGRNSRKAQSDVNAPSGAGK